MCFPLQSKIITQKMGNRTMKSVSRFLYCHTFHNIIRSCQWQLLWHHLKRIFETCFFYICCAECWCQKQGIWGRRYLGTVFWRLMYRCEPNPVRTSCTGMQHLHNYDKSFKVSQFLMWKFLPKDVILTLSQILLNFPCLYIADAGFFQFLLQGRLCLFRSF